MIECRQELARRAFEGILDMKKSPTLSGLEQVAAPLFETLGLPSFALATFFRADRSANTKVLAGRFHPEWSRRYIERGYARSSTISREIMTASSPYTWSDAIRRRGLTPDQAEIWNEAAAFGLTDGLFTPVRWADGSYAAVVAAGEKPDLADPMLLLGAEMLSAYYASEARRLINPGLASPALSKRQRECLAWVREGKSSAAISAILGISVATVDEHVAEACRRLGVRTRVQGAVEATVRGLIH
jgi:DNA-binding CsgD family transcriptional regulator